MVLAVALTANVSVAAKDLLVAVPMWLAGGVLRFLFTWCLALTAFWTERVHSITAFGTTLMYLLGGTAVPVGLMPRGLGEVARLLPFYAMIGLPAATVVGQPVTAVLSGFAVQVGWLCALGMLAVILWRRGLTRYTAVGG